MADYGALFHQWVLRQFSPSSALTRSEGESKARRHQSREYARDAARAEWGEKRVTDTFRCPPPPNTNSGSLAGAVRAPRCPFPCAGAANAGSGRPLTSRCRPGVQFCALPGRELGTYLAVSFFFKIHGSRYDGVRYFQVCR